MPSNTPAAAAAAASMQHSHSSTVTPHLQPPQPTAVKRCVAIINPKGANGRSHKLWQKLSADVKQRLSAAYTVEEQFTTAAGSRGHPGSASQLAAAAAEARADLVLAVGGDGTIHDVVSGLVQAQQKLQQQQPHTALAVLPLGTGSDWARTFGWRLNDAAAACQRILSGEQQLASVSVLRPQTPSLPPPQQSGSDTAAETGDKAAAADDAPTPLGDDHSDRYCVNVASCCVGALSAAKAGSLKQFGTLCYPLGGALTLIKWKGLTVQVCLDDSSEWQTVDRLTTLVLGQGRFWGGGLQILPGADPTEGVMDVCALQGLGLWDFISKGHLLRSGKHVHVKGVNMLGKCRRLRVRSTQPGIAVPWEADGEPQGHFESVEIKVLPGALKLLSGKPPAPVVL